MSLSVYTHQIDSTVNKSFYLDGTATSSSNVALDLIGGTSQSLSGDFGVETDGTGTRIIWDAPYGLYDQLMVKDIVRVIYDRS